MPATANLVTVTANARLWERLYDYDLMGNLLRMRHVSSNSPNSFTRLYNPDANNNMVTQFGANNRTTRLRTGTTNIDYLYDASGNMSRESTNRNLEYDHRQLTRLYMISTSGYEHYQYGSGGELVKRFSRSGSEFYSNVEIDGLFQYNNRLNVATDHQNKINVLDSSGNTVAQRRMGSAMGEAAYASDELYMLHNHTGSIIGTYDLNGAQQEGEDFYPFGETAHNWNGNKLHRFGGKLRSFSSGFYLFGARQYAPWLAKFTSVDPLAAKSTDRNPYHYASNNPINRVDPSGMKDKPNGNGSKNGPAKSDNISSQKKSIEELVSVNEAYSQPPVEPKTHNVNKDDFMKDGKLDTKAFTEAKQSAKDKNKQSKTEYETQKKEYEGLQKQRNSLINAKEGTALGELKNFVLEKQVPVVLNAGVSPTKDKRNEIGNTDYSFSLNLDGSKKLERLDIYTNFEKLGKQEFGSNVTNALNVEANRATYNDGGYGINFKSGSFPAYLPNELGILVHELGHYFADFKGIDVNSFKHLNQQNDIEAKPEFFERRFYLGQ